MHSHSSSGSPLGPQLRAVIFEIAYQFLFSWCRLKSPVGVDSRSWGHRLVDVLELLIAVGVAEPSSVLRLALKTIPSSCSSSATIRCWSEWPCRLSSSASLRALLHVPTQWRLRIAPSDRFDPGAPDPSSNDASLSNVFLRPSAGTANPTRRRAGNLVQFLDAFDDRPSRDARLP